jgi:NADH-quinone oxidoreductase subunit L
MNTVLLALIPLLPLTGAVLLMLFGLRLPRVFVGILAVGAVAASTVATVLLWPAASGDGLLVVLYAWAAVPGLDLPLTLHFNPLSAPMTLMVTFVSTLIHLYAVAYMAKEEDVVRFFALLNLFVFAMLLIVLADSLLLVFIGWEGVGFCSYALIGFWYQEGKNADAGRKAFLVTRVGDVFFGIALLWLFSLTGTLSIAAINAQATQLPAATVTGIGLLLLLGASGKSAQLPLMSWLADAMAGPTPVSALIHAATMVTAGVYLLCRFFPLISLSPTALLAIATVGALTAFYAATCALAQREIKRVLAYSTMSQVGFMLLAVGAGSVGAAMFHLLTHAFFKALLFMAAGVVIHLADGENDLFKLGGLARKAPQVAILFVIGALCLAGMPMTGGFFSKDAILLAVGAHPEPAYKLLWLLAVVSALLTAIYTFRLVCLVCAGPPRTQVGHAAAPGLVAPLWPLALLGLFAGALNLPPLLGGNKRLVHFLGSYAGLQPDISYLAELGQWGLAALLVFIGWRIALIRWGKQPAATEGARADFFRSGWQIDSLIATVLLRPFSALCRFSSEKIDKGGIDGILAGLVQCCRFGSSSVLRMATGRLSTAVTSMTVGVLLLAVWGVWTLLLR